MQVSVTAGTIFQDSHLPLTTWFRTLWYVASQKNGVSALGLQREMGLGSYRSAWAMLHKLRRAMVRPGRDKLRGRVEVDETYWGGEETGVTGRLIEEKTPIIVAAECDGPGLGRVRLRCIPDLTRAAPSAPMDCPPIWEWRVTPTTGVSNVTRSPEST